jgi:hypothetical protein
MSVFKKAMDAGAVCANHEAICETCGNKRMMFTWNHLERCSTCIGDLIDESNGHQKISRKRGIADSVHKLTQAVTGSSKGGKIFGKLMVWSLSDVEMLRDELEHLTERTIGKEYMPRKPQKRMALRRALRACESDGLIRKIRNDDVMLAYGLVEELPDEVNIDLDLNKLNIIILNKQSETLEFRGNHKNNQIQELFEKYSEAYTTEDVRKMIVNYIKARHGISVRDMGGTYYLRSVEDAETAQAFIQGLNSGSQALLFSVFDDSESRNAVGSLAKESMEKELELLAEEIKDLMAKNASETLLAKRLDRFKALRKKARVYEDCMKYDAEILSQNLDALQKEVREAFEGKIQEYPQAALFPYQSRVRYTGAKVEKYGTFGTVVGYSVVPRKTDQSAEYVKVLMDKTGTIQPFGVSTLSL